MGRLRPVKDEDREKLLSTSYTKFDTFCNCQRRYRINYIDKKYTNSETLALELGSILHKALEIKGQYKINGEEVDYEKIKQIVMDGCDETDHLHLNGINKIKRLYAEDWYGSFEDPNNIPYQHKVVHFLEDVIYSRMEDPAWKIVGVEIPFEFVYDDRCIIHGYIDRVDVNEEGAYRVVDYKSGKKVFDDVKVKTPLQMVIYDLACLFMYGSIPQYHEYDFILINKKQTEENGACTKGYLNRGLKKIDGILNSIDQAREDNFYPPSPTPLCYWCPYTERKHSPNADKKMGGECQYYSLWTPENKTFKVNKEFIPEEDEKPKRKLVF